METGKSFADLFGKGNLAARMLAFRVEPAVTTNVATWEAITDS